MTSEKKLALDNNLVKMIKQGMTQVQIAKRLGMSKSGLSQRLKRMGIDYKKFRREQMMQEYEEYCQKKWGCSGSDYEKMLADKDRRNLARKLLTRTKQRAWKIKLENTLKLWDVYSLLGDTACPVLGVPYEQNGPYVRSIDRIDNNIGYIRENIQVVSWRANFLKSNATPQELLKLVNFLGK